MKYIELLITAAILAGIAFITLAPAMFLAAKPQPAKFTDRFDAAAEDQRPALKGDLEAAGLAIYHSHH